MTKFISASIKKIAGFLSLLSDKISPQPLLKEVPASLQSIRVKPWFNDNGDKTHRVNYELNADSVVLDLGGYEGQWAADIFCKYGCTIHIFEPVKEFADNIEDRFKSNSKVTVHNYGLGKLTAHEKLQISADCSSTFRTGQESVEIQVVKIDDFLNAHHINYIDLMKVNIEGGEFELLEHLIQSNQIVYFENIQVQFHDFVPNATGRMKGIQDNLSKTHYLTYQYEFVWENWKRKS